MSSLLLNNSIHYFLRNRFWFSFCAYTLFFFVIIPKDIALNLLLQLNKSTWVYPAIGIFILCLLKAFQAHNDQYKTLAHYYYSLPLCRSDILINLALNQLIYSTPLILLLFLGSLSIGEPQSFLKGFIVIILSDVFLGIILREIKNSSKKTHLKIKSYYFSLLVEFLVKEKVKYCLLLAISLGISLICFLSIFYTNEKNQTNTLLWIQSTMLPFALGSLYQNISSFINSKANWMISLPKVKLFIFKHYLAIYCPLILFHIPPLMTAPYYQIISVLYHTVIFFIISFYAEKSFPLISFFLISFEIYFLRGLL